MNIDVVIPTYYAKLDILNKTVKENCDLLKKMGVRFRYIVVVDFHSGLDNRLSYLDIMRTPNVEVYFKANISEHKESFRAINFGIQIGEFENVLVMDDDYLLSKKYIDKVKDFVGNALFLKSFYRNDGERVWKDSIKDGGQSIGSGQPKLLKRDFLLSNGLYQEEYVGYMFCDTEFSYRYEKLDGVEIEDGDVLDIMHLEHCYRYRGRDIDKERLHLLYFKQNKENLERHIQCLT